MKKIVAVKKSGKCRRKLRTACDTSFVCELCTVKKKTGVEFRSFITNEFHMLFVSIQLYFSSYAAPRNFFISSMLDREKNPVVSLYGTATAFAHMMMSLSIARHCY